VSTRTNVFWEPCAYRPGWKRLVWEFFDEDGLLACWRILKERKV
jgi:hypothetical protein